MLRKGLSVGLFLAVLAAVAGAAAGDEPRRGEGKRVPRAVFEETFKDFGAQSLTDEVEHAFHVRNEGDAVLRIDRVSPSCDCTVAEFAKKIKPGETGTITLKLHGKEGPLESVANVHTNEPEGQNIHALRVRVIFMGPIEFDPEPRVTFEGPSPPKWQVVHIRNLDPLDMLSIEQVFVSSQLKDYVEVYTEPVENKREYAIVFTLLKFPPPGERVNANVQLQVRRYRDWRKYDIQVRLFSPSPDSPPKR